MPTSRLVPGRWTRLPDGAGRYSAVRDQVLSRLEAGLVARAGCRSVSSWRLVGGSSPTRASTGSYTANSRVPRITGWRHYLPRAKSKRGWRGRRGRQSCLLHGSCARPIRRAPPRAPLTASTPGHWEADLMLFQDIWTCGADHARTPLPSSSLPVRPPGKASQPRSPAPSSQVLGQLPAAAGDGRLPSTTGPSSPSIYRLHDLGIRNLLLRYPLPLAEGRGGERHRPVAADSAPQDRPGGVARWSRLHR